MRVVKNSDKIMENKDKIANWILEYEKKLIKGYSDNAWTYFDYERLKMHPFWNGYRCSKCQSLCAIKNKPAGLCLKCLVIREKIDVLHKILKELKKRK